MGLMNIRDIDFSSIPHITRFFTIFIIHLVNTTPGKQNFFQKVFESLIDLGEVLVGKNCTEVIAERQLHSLTLVLKHLTTVFFKINK